MGARTIAALVLAAVIGCARLTAAGAAGEGTPVEYVQRPDKLFPEHRRLLAKSGHLALVLENIDLLRYYPWDGFEYPKEKMAIGMATYENGVRTAHIATKGRSDIDIVAIIVHEAAHLSGIAARRRMLDEDAAEAVAAQFRRAVGGPTGTTPSRVRPEPPMLDVLMAAVRDWLGSVASPPLSTGNRDAPSRPSRNAIDEDQLLAELQRARDAYLADLDRWIGKGWR